MPMPDVLALFRKNKERAVSLGIDKETFSVGFSELVARKDISEGKKAKVLNDPHYSFKNNDGLLMSRTPAINFVFHETRSYNIAKMLLVLGADPRHCNIFNHDGDPPQNGNSFFHYLDEIDVLTNIDELQTDDNSSSDESRNNTSLRAVAEKAVDLIEAAKHRRPPDTTLFQQRGGEVVRLEEPVSEQCCCTIM